MRLYAGDGTPQRSLCESWPLRHDSARMIPCARPHAKSYQTHTSLNVGHQRVTDERLVSAASGTLSPERWGGIDGPDTRAIHADVRALHALLPDVDGGGDRGLRAPFGARCVPELLRTVGPQLLPTPNTIVFLIRELFGGRAARYPRYQRASTGE